MKNKVKYLLKDQLYKSARSRALFTLYGVVFKELSVCFKQFFTWRNPLRFLTIYCSSLVRVLLGRSLKYSYAFTGEDRVLESIYKPLIGYNGFYVEVGCNHPVFLSNTYTFYRKGWRGICIDANPVLIKKFRSKRPKDTAVCALVSNEDTQRDFYIAQNDVLSTTVQENLSGEDMKEIQVEKVRLPTRSLTSILDEAKAPHTIDILSVDAEEHDLEVIQSLDLLKYNPQLIIVEDELFDIADPSSNSLVKHLKQYDYQLIGFVLKNLYFKKS